VSTTVATSERGDQLAHALDRMGCPNCGAPLGSEEPGEALAEQLLANRLKR
jgi:hypothetical protein